MKDIEEMTLSELDRIASAEQVNIPADLESSIEELTDGLEAVRQLAGIEKKRPLLWAGIAASAVILAGTGWGLTVNSGPKDTFDDPMQAYAEAQKAIQTISAALDSGAEKTSEAMASFERPKDILDKIMK